MIGGRLLKRQIFGSRTKFNSWRASIFFSFAFLSSKTLSHLLFSLWQKVSVLSSASIVLSLKMMRMGAGALAFAALDAIGYESEEKPLSADRVSRP